MSSASFSSTPTAIVKSLEEEPAIERVTRSARASPSSSHRREPVADIDGQAGCAVPCTRFSARSKTAPRSVAPPGRPRAARAPCRSRPRRLSERAPPRGLITLGVRSDRGREAIRGGERAERGLGHVGAELAVRVVATGRGIDHQRPRALAPA